MVRTTALAKMVEQPSPQTSSTQASTGLCSAALLCGPSGCSEAGRSSSCFDLTIAAFANVVEQQILRGNVGSTGPL